MKTTCVLKCPKCGRQEIIFVTPSVDWEELVITDWNNRPCSKDGSSRAVFIIRDTEEAE